ncbi:MAG: hypothetical protein SFX73_03075 [Kofleriaceae bacterium]|nr:hypothetical protein [Kofleriaceae bacterium]
MRLVLFVSLLAACGGAAKPPTSPSNNAGTSSNLPAAYASVFKPATLSFKGEIVRSESTDTGPSKTTEAMTVSCTVGDVATKPEYSIATLKCSTSSEEGFPDDPSGTFVGTPTGLYRVEAFDGDLTKLTDKQRLLPAEPKKDKREWPGSDEGFGEAMIVEPHAGGWCASHGVWGGDEGGWTLCFHPDKGVVGGSSFFAGGMSKDVFFGDVPRT